MRLAPPTGQDGDLPLSRFQLEEPTASCRFIIAMKATQEPHPSSDGKGFHPDRSRYINNVEPRRRREKTGLLRESLWYDSASSLPGYRQTIFIMEIETVVLQRHRSERAWSCGTVCD